jgi:hypothetical protein
MKLFGVNIISAIVMFFIYGNLFAQKGVEDGSKYGRGHDSVRCLVNLTLSRDRVKAGNYEDALNYWRVAYNECPQSSQYLYIDGSKMFNELIVAEKDPVRQDALIDTLMMIYDQRMKYFDQKGNILGRKAVDLLKYRNNITAVGEAYKYLEESINLLKNKSLMPVIDAFMVSTIALYSAGKVSDMKVIENYLHQAPQRASR